MATAGRGASPETPQTPAAPLGGAAPVARAGCGPGGGWDRDAAVCVRVRGGRAGSGCARGGDDRCRRRAGDTRVSAGCAGSAERLGARGAVGPANARGSWHSCSRTSRTPVLLTDKEGGQLPPDEALDEAVPEYRAPGRKSLLEIQQLDPDDQSLAKYKQALLGPLPPVADPSLPNVQVTRLTLMSEQAPGPITMDLTGELAALKNQVFILKEGVDYRVKITFKVNKEIVSGLRCLHHTYRQGLRVDKAVYMVGSYGPSAQEYEFVTPVEEAPRGALVRGAYVVTSFFTDDDRTDHLSWQWGLQICRDWES
ncbi:rho GDP-dissociation inhibitor 3 [Equus quagga]|uniref:rho GDP-dissociation inhibitor 3 n=1 Tax=Equus quagga TaxID=89248 RepID=UPI001EE1694E|nr:rho GDP-dissociation inhibitor 3 [Equus quagga]